MSEESTKAKRMKLDALSLVASGCLSMKSDRLIEQLWNLEGENFPFMPRIKLEEAASPAPSCLSMKSERSMDPPQNFSCVVPLQPTIHFTEDDFRCLLCTEILKDPVSIPCGHSYCRQCISSYWIQPNHAGLYACPQCSHTYISWPALYTNSALAKVAKKLQHFSPVLPADCYTGAGDVCCDFCTKQKLRAVKFCLNCMASYCEPHIRQHYTVPVLQRHTLVEPQHQDESNKKQTEHLKQHFMEPHVDIQTDANNCFRTTTVEKLYRDIMMLASKEQGELDQQIQKLQELQGEKPTQQELQQGLLKLQKQWNDFGTESEKQDELLQKQYKDELKQLTCVWNKRHNQRNQLWQELWEQIKQ